MRDLIQLIATAVNLALLAFALCFCAPPSFLLKPVETKIKVETALQQLPRVPGSNVIERRDGISGGSEEGCGVLVIDELQATNEMSYNEILDFYAKLPQTTNWTLRARYPDGFSFKQGDVSFGLSDENTINLVGPKSRNDAKRKFRTIFFISLSSPLDPSNYNRCRQ